MELLGGQRSVIISICRLEVLFDDCQVLVLAQRSVLVRIAGRKLLCAETPAQFLPIYGPLVIRVEFVERGSRRRLRLGEVDGPGIVGIERGYGSAFPCRSFASDAATAKMPAATTPSMLARRVIMTIPPPSRV